MGQDLAMCCIHVNMLCFICPPDHEKWFSVFSSLVFFFKWGLIIGPHKEAWKVPHWDPSWGVTVLRKSDFHSISYLRLLFINTLSRVMYVCLCPLTWSGIKCVLGWENSADHSITISLDQNQCWSQHSCYCSFSSSWTLLESKLHKLIFCIYHSGLYMIIGKGRDKVRQDKTRRDPTR